MKNTKLSIVFCCILSVLAMVVLFFLLLPAISLRSGSFFGFMVILVLVIIAIFGGTLLFTGNDDFFQVAKVILIVGLVIIGISVIIAFVNTTLFTSKKLQSIPEVKEGVFEEDYVEISNAPADAFTLDLDSAERLGNRAIGKIDNASWYEVDNEFNLITYQNVKYRISPLEYGGMFKYFKAKNSGIPGYVLVNDDTYESTFVKTDKPIKYSPSAYFSYNLKRHLRLQYFSYTFTKSMFEIDEEGTPFWITGVSKPNASVYAGRTIEKIIVTNASTGESTVYSLDKIPDWIDHAYSLEYLMTQAKWHYEYVKGFWNTVFSKTGIYRTSYEYRYQIDDSDDDTANFFGYNSFINKNGEVVFVTGLTPANKSESNAGFITMNTRTGELISYSAEGAEESSAQQACESKMQNYGYRATYPVFVNVAGQPTYMMALKDKAGIIQAYGFVNLKNYSITSVNENIDVALKEYKKAIGVESNEETVETDSYEVVSGKIEEIYSQTIDGTTYYYYVVGGNLYKASVDVNELQFLFKVGDKIELKYQTSANYRVVVTISK